MSAADQRMTRGEREDLQRLIRQREKVLKSAARERSAQLVAEFENQLGSQYAFDQDEVWAEAARLAEREVKKAQEKIAARCRELDIPKQFSPELSLGWHRRGENAVAQRRTELRAMAKSRIEALERTAMVEIERASLEAQTQLALDGLTSDAARAFVERLPSVEKLMPALSLAEIAGEADPPIAEQLVSPNALRQRRFRERQKALRNEPSNVTPLLRNANEGA
jgi:hypothetical protein